MQLLLGLCVELEGCVVCAYAEKCEDLRVVFQYTLLSGRVTGNCYRYQPFDTQMYSDLRPSLENLNMVLLSSIIKYWCTVKNFYGRTGASFHKNGLICSCFALEFGIVRSIVCHG